MSSTRILLTLSLTGVTLIVACEKTDPNFCPGANPNNNCLDDGGGRLCTSSAQCEPPTPVCDPAAMLCVQCLADETSACPATSPICSDDHTCQPCSAHIDCASLACLPTGACGDDTNVAYVDPTGTDNAQCTKAMPCTELASALGTRRPYVKLRGATDEAVTINDQNVTLLADPGARLIRTSIGVILEIKGTSRVEIYDLDILDGLGATGVGLSMPTGNTATVTLQRVTLSNNSGGGIVASGGSLTVAQSTLSGNQAGGISVSGLGATFDITNNFIFRNGDQDNGIFGGVQLSVGEGGASRFEFNTIVDNRAGSGATRVGGIFCDLPDFTAANNIVARNTVGGSSTAQTAQTLGVCAYPSSRIQNDVQGLGFQSSDIAPFNYKLTANSVAVNAATTPSTVAVDHEGDPRPQGPQNDIGADELRP